MAQCAYCDRSCSPTREHVVPDWYNETPGDAETFNAREPFIHTRGDILIKDVCKKCNNGPLADLDAYGKDLYERYFSLIAYDPTTVEFSFEAPRLIRWLLKLSYNSGRAHNADIAALHALRKAMLGEEPLTDHVQCWVHLVSAACITESGEVRAARCNESEDSEIFEPKWFRIGQLRLPGSSTTECVQRQIVINSFAFSLLIAPSSTNRPSKMLNELVQAFQEAVPAAKRIERTATEVTISASDTHAIASWYPLFHHYPSRFGNEQNPYIPKLPKRGLGAIVLAVTGEIIENNETSPVIEALHYMVATRENATAFKQRVVLMIQGFDDDPRAVWQIPKARDYVRTVFEQCPFIMFLTLPQGDTLNLMLGCWLGEAATLPPVQSADRITEFNCRAFSGLNDMAFRLAISRETIFEISESAMHFLYGWP